MLRASRYALQEERESASCSFAAALTKSLSRFAENFFYRDCLIVPALKRCPPALDLFPPGAMDFFLCCSVEAEPEIVGEGGALLRWQCHCLGEDVILLGHYTESYASVPSSISCRPLPLGTMG